MKNLLKLSCAAAIAFSATAALAQSGNGSDVTGPPGGTTVTFAPLGVPGGAAGGGGGAGGGTPAQGQAGSNALSNAGNTLRGGAPVTSPATGQTIPAAAASNVGQLISSGSPASVASLTGALQAAGAPSGATSTLAVALAALAGATPGTSFGLIVSALNAFNAFVAAAPASFFAGGTLPAQFLAVHSALSSMSNAIQ